jgi:hypothetical protein
MSLRQEKAQFVPRKESRNEHTPLQHPNGTSTTAASVNPREDFNPQDDFRGVHPEDRYTIPEVPNEEEVTQRNEGAIENNKEPVVEQEDQMNT